MNRSASVNWLLNYYNIYIKNDTKILADEESKNIMSVYSEDERSKLKCARIKVEQKDSVNLDFNDKMKIYIGISPLETFMLLMKVLFFKFFAGLRKSEDSCQILFEITVEFSKSEEKYDIYSYEDEYVTTNNMYEECEERRTVREYSALSYGNVINIQRILNEFSNINTKVINTFNVVGSNWSVRRIINININIMYDIVFFLFDKQIGQREN